MRRRLVSIIATAACLSLFSGAMAVVQAKTPTKVKQLVYGVNLYQGKGFSGTFVPRVENKLSMVANRGNVISPKVSLVYYWPITGEYMADWETMNQDVGGKLEILKDGVVIKTLEKVDVGFNYPNGPYDDVASLLIGEKAQEAYKAFTKATDEFYEAQAKYYTDQQAYEQEIMDALEKAQKGVKIDPKDLPKAPKEPVPPTTYVTQPFRAFVVNLPVGNYQMRLVQSGGAVVKDSVKEVRVVAPRGSGIGYEISAETEWPAAAKADQPNNVIYYNSKKTLFINPYLSEELPLYDYMKITQLHKPSSNNAPKDAWSWVFGDPIKDAKVQVLNDGKVVDSFVEQPFYIEQSGTDTARRNFVVFKKENYSREQSPHLVAYRAKVTKKKIQSLRLVDANGKVIPGSEREIRLITGRNPKELLYASVAPLLFGLLLIIYRNLKTSGRRKTVTVQA